MARSVGANLHEQAGHVMGQACPPPPPPARDWKPLRSLQHPCRQVDGGTTGGGLNQCVDPFDHCQVGVWLRCFQEATLSERTAWGYHLHGDAKAVTVPVRQVNSCCHGGAAGPGDELREGLELGGEAL